MRFWIPRFNYSCLGHVIPSNWQRPSIIHVLDTWFHPIDKGVLQFFMSCRPGKHTINWQTLLTTWQQHRLISSGVSSGIFFRVLPVSPAKWSVCCCSCCRPPKKRIFARRFSTEDHKSEKSQFSSSESLPGFLPVELNAILGWHIFLRKIIWQINNS